LLAGHTPHSTEDDYLINELDILCRAELGNKICCQILQLLQWMGGNVRPFGCLACSHIAHTPCGSCTQFRWGPLDRSTYLLMAIYQTDAPLPHPLLPTKSKKKKNSHWQFGQVTHILLAWDHNSIVFTWLRPSLRIGKFLIGGGVYSIQHFFTPSSPASQLAIDFHGER